ncbi:MAG TPA: enoyl-CoA hydratase-related protein [Thermoleophilaceae bacterium]|nr:enoyl-CoA hydratase-related protein [Thermoleophilaceae bacterium]
MPTDITLDRSEGVATITLGAPGRRNALTLDMARELVEACEQIDADPSVGAVVVTGGEFFCAGGDRQTLADAGRDPATPDAWEGIGLVYRSFARVGELEPPTVAAIRGGAVGAGVNLAFATDLRVVASDAKIVSGFLQIGLHPGGGHGVLLGRTGAREAAAAMAMFGQGIDGARAAELGLAWAAVDDAEVEPTARELARAPAADPELARRVARSLRAELGPPALPWAAALDMERASQMWSMRRKDLKG